MIDIVFFFFFLFRSVPCSLLVFVFHAYYISTRRKAMEEGVAGLISCSFYSFLVFFFFFFETDTRTDDGQKKTKKT